MIALQFNCNYANGTTAFSHCLQIIKWDIIIRKLNRCDNFLLYFTFIASWHNLCDKQLFKFDMISANSIPTNCKWSEVIFQQIYLNFSFIFLHLNISTSSIFRHMQYYQIRRDLKVRIYILNKPIHCYFDISSHLDRMAFLLIIVFGTT